MEIAMVNVEEQQNLVGNGHVEGELPIQNAVNEPPPTILQAWKCYFWLLLFWSFHFTAVTLSLFNFIYAKWFPKGQLAIFSLCLIYYILAIPAYRLLTLIYKCAIKILKWLGKWEPLGNLVTTGLHSFMVLQAKELLLIQLMFAFYVASIICYIRLVARGDPLGLIRSFGAVFTPSAIHFMKTGHILIGVIFILIPVLSAFALILDKGDKKPTIGMYLGRILEGIADIEDELVAGN